MFRNSFIAEPTKIIRDSVAEAAAAFLSRLPFLATAMVLLLLTWLVSRFGSRLFRRTLERAHLRPSLRDLFLQLFSITVWIAGLLLALTTVFPGITPSKLIAALGLGSVAIGLAFKDIFENFFAGILILWKFPFDPGDVIEVDGILGTVEDITVRMTLIRQPNDELVVLPNATLFKNSVRILTNKASTRQSIICGIAYGEDVAQVRTIIKKAVEGCQTVAESQEPQIFAKAFGASSIDFEVAWWSGSTPLAIRRSRDEVVEAIKAALDSSGIEIPFPYRTLTFKEPLSLLGSSTNADPSRGKDSDGGPPVAAGPGGSQLGPSETP